MKKLLIVCFLLCCGINSANAQLAGLITKAIIDRRAKKARNSSHNFIYKRSGDIVYIKKGKEKIASDSDLRHGIDTLVFEDSSIPVGRTCSELLRQYDINVFVSNNTEYLEPSKVESRIGYDFINGIATYYGVQGFQAQKPSGYGHELNRKADENVSCVKLPDAIIIDGDDGEFRGYFCGTAIEKIVFSPKIRKIGKGAFRGCSSLQEVVFPDGCDNVEIDPEAFIGCNALKSIRVPNGKGQDYINMGLPEALIMDGDATLNLKIELQKTGTILSKIPLKDLNKISSLSVTGFLDENDIEVLKECINLKKLDLSNAYTTLSEELQKKRKANSAFLRGMIQAMGELSQKKYENGEISTVDNLQVQLFADLVKGSSDVKNASVGCVIPTGSFSGMKNLETVILPVRASEIEREAFQNCPNLKEVMLPPYLKEIGTGAFAFCSNLKSIVFPKTLTTIGSYDKRHLYDIGGAASFVETGIEMIDFSNCIFENNTSDNWSYRFHCKNLKVIKLPNTDDIDVGFGSDSQVICYVPSSVKRLRFFDRIKEIHFSSPNPPYVKGGLSNCIIYVPKGCLTQYYAKFKGNGNTLNEE